MLLKQYNCFQSPLEARLYSYDQLGIDSLQNYKMLFELNLIMLLLDIFAFDPASYCNLVQDKY